VVICKGLSVCSIPLILSTVRYVTEESKKNNHDMLGSSVPCYGMVYDVFQHVAFCCRQSQLHEKGESIFVFEQSYGVLVPCALHKSF
jgi:hypothetical protein